MKEYGRRLGYRLVVSEATWEASVRRGGELSVSLVWGNEGNAPPYVDLALEVSLVSGDGKVACSRVVDAEQMRTKGWLPGEEHRTEAAVAIPSEVKAGTYTVAASVFEPGAAEGGSPPVRRRIQLGIAGGEEGRYALGQVQVE